MADALHEFYNTDGLGFATLKTGVNIGGTTSSQKAVIRDIQVTNVNNKVLTIKIGNLVVGTIGKTEDLSGTLILKESQNLTLSCNDEITWTGLRTHYYDAKSVRQLNWDADYFFTVPDGVSYTTGSDGWKHDTADTYFRANENNFQDGANLDNTTGYIFGWDAEAMFGKPTGDYYFTRWFYGANANAGASSNKIYYYDRSADSSTQVYAGSSTNSRRNWEGGWTNRYLVCFAGSGSTIYNFDAFDTTTNSLVSNNATFIRGYDSNTTGEAQIEDFSYNQRQGTIMDKYCLMRHMGYSGGARIATLLDVTTGRYRTWIGGASDSHYDERIMENNSSYANYHSTSQICKGTDGVYYVIWTYIRGTSANQSGFQVWSLGTDPAATILAHGSDASNSYSFGTLKYTFDDGGSNYNHWNKFRLTDDDKRYRRGYMSGFVPLKKITPTDSGCRYWAFLGQNKSWVIDIQASSSSGIYPIFFNQGTVSGDPDVFGNESNHAYLATNCWPIYDTTKAANGWGTVGARTTGILNT